MRFKPIKKMMDSNHIMIQKFGNYLAYVWQYMPILKQLVDKDLKGRFKNTVIGYFWHLLNPLFQILIYYLIFAVMFGRNIPDYWLYLSTGMFAFSFFIGSTAGNSNCITSNISLVTKISIAREILPAAKVISSLISLSISYSLLILLSILCGVGVTINIILLPLIIVFFAIFCLGTCYILSSVTVYVRDVPNAATIVLSCLMFAVPIFYLANDRATPAMELFWSVNPLYYFIESIHDVLYYGATPTLLMITVCVVSSIIMLILGLIVFKRLEPGFAERL